MSFRLWTIFYVFALVAAAMATFGPGGIAVSVIVLGFWTWRFYGPQRELNFMPVFVAFTVIATLFALVIPVSPSAREAARRAQCRNNLKQIVLALLNYESATGSFPPAYVTDANGKPMHSWRTLILPYLEELPLYQTYNFSEPWDGPNNSKLMPRIPFTFQCPSQPVAKAGSKYETQYFAVVGPESVFPGDKGVRIRDIRDGTANTIMVIEATGLGINWMEPRDVTVDEAIHLLTSNSGSSHLHTHEGFFTTTYHETSQRNVAFVDGHVVYLGQFSDPAIAKALLTIAGGESIPAELSNEYMPCVATTVINWRNIYALSMFVVVALLPSMWLRRQRARNAPANKAEKEATDEQTAPQNISII